MNILIFGGSGILSADFVKKCLDEENSVTIVNRGRRREFIDSRAKLVCADIREESVDSLQNKINSQQYDVVVDFLSFTPSHMEKTLKVIDGSYRHYIFISSATAYKKNHEDEIITEETPLGNDRWEYAYQKYLCEEYLRKVRNNYTIIRPYVTYSVKRIPFPIIPDGYYYTLIKRMKSGKPIPLFEGGKAVCTLMHTIDFSNILYKLLLNENAYGEAFHITGNAVQPWKDVYYLICRILGCTPNDFSVDSKSVQKYLPEFYQILVGDKGTDMVFDNSKVMSAIGGYSFTVSLEDGLKKSIDFYEENLFMQTLDYKWDGRIDYLYRKCTGNTSQPLKCLSGVDSQRRQWRYYAMRFPLTNIAYDFLWRYKNRESRRK